MPGSQGRSLQRQMSISSRHLAAATWVWAGFLAHCSGGVLLQLIVIPLDHLEPLHANAIVSTGEVTLEHCQSVLVMLLSWTYNCFMLQLRRFSLGMELLLQPARKLRIILGWTYFFLHQDNSCNQPMIEMIVLVLVYIHIIRILACHILQPIEIKIEPIRLGIKLYNQMIWYNLVNDCWLVGSWSVGLWCLSPRTIHFQAKSFHNISVRSKTVADTTVILEHAWLNITTEPWLTTCNQLMHW